MPKLPVLLLPRLWVRKINLIPLQKLHICYLSEAKNLLRIVV